MLLGWSRGGSAGTRPSHHLARRPLQVHAGSRGTHTGTREQGQTMDECSRQVRARKPCTRRRALFRGVAAAAELLCS
jgi:hypothetical protein